MDAFSPWVKSFTTSSERVWQTTSVWPSSVSDSALPCMRRISCVWTFWTFSESLATGTSDLTVSRPDSSRHATQGQEMEGSIPTPSVVVAPVAMSSARTTDRGWSVGDLAVSCAQTIRP